VHLQDCDMPGRPIRRVQCDQCGEWVQDCREVEREDRLLCRACAGARYYEVVDETDSASQLRSAR